MRSRSEAEAAGYALHDGERGTVTAEFAVVLPSVMLVLALCLGAVNVIGQQVALGSLAASGARMLARGDDPGAVRAQVVSAAPGAALAQSTDGAFVCVALTRPARFGPVGLGSFAPSARDCALASTPGPGG
ncbi:hypothetical protein GCM10022286_30140 [Gryllotalpicola daejeonensis]|uniref:Pilus assembly protein n=1 Tax=Gryllotalpicola daejeonensis TaxID=993087 RepID=A0ABP7ZNI7_9MICO